MASKVSRNALVVIAVFVTLFALKNAVEIVAPLLLAGFIAVILSGILQRWQKAGLPPVVAVGVMLCALIAATVFIVTVIGNSVSEFQANSNLYQANLLTKIKGLAGFSVFGIDLGTHAAHIMEYINPNSAISITLRLLRSATDIFSSGFTLFLLIVFMIADAGSIIKKLHTASGNSALLLSHLTSIIEQLRHYLSIKFITSCMTGVLVYVMLVAIGIDFPLLWGFIAFLLNFIPNIGSIIAAFPALILAWVQFDLLILFWVLLGYALINICVGSLLEPKMLHDALGLSLLAVFVSLIFWGWMFGIIGMFLSVPLTMVIKITLGHYPSTQFFAQLL